MTKEELDRLESIAKAATPGEWKEKYAYSSLAGDLYRISPIQSEDEDATFLMPDAAHISAFNPSTALKLIGDLRKAIKALESISSKDNPLHDNEEYWLEIAHNMCAKIIATDTEIARNALADIRGSDE